MEAHRLIMANVAIQKRESCVSAPMAARAKEVDCSVSGESSAIAKTAMMLVNTKRVLEMVPL